jgi:adenylate kinase family enzyme
MKGFDVIMKDDGRDFHAIHLLLDPDTGLQRVIGRAEKEGRADDANEEIIKRRMQTFFDKTMPVIDAYKAQGKVTEVQGDRAMEEVYGDLRKIVTSL